MKGILLLLVSAFSIEAAPTNSSSVTEPGLPRPTSQNVRYGPHERNVLDFWQAKSVQPTPLLYYVHGGAWVQGDKSMVPSGLLKFMLDHRISVASANYRYSSQARLPAPVHDAARALQFIRSKSKEWNLNPARVAAMGASAGACTALWLAYHDDLADPKNDDPVARESTRLCSAVGVAGQTSIDPRVVVPWVGEIILKHGMIWRAVGATNRPESMEHYERYRELYREFSPINHVSRDDPPVFLYYSPPTPLPATNAGMAIHHAIMGQKLKEKADAAGLECELNFAEPPTEDAPAIRQFLLKHLMEP